MDRTQIYTTYIVLLTIAYNDLTLRTSGNLNKFAQTSPPQNQLQSRPGHKSQPKPNTQLPHEKNVASIESVGFLTPLASRVRNTAPSMD